MVLSQNCTDVPVISHLGPCKEIQMSLKEMLRVSINFYSPTHLSVPIDQLPDIVDARYSTHISVGRDQYIYYTSLQDNVTGKCKAVFSPCLLRDTPFADELRQKIHHWLSPPDPSSNHHAACKKRQPTTGMWFIDGEDFKRWKGDLNSFIWLYGIRMSYRYSVYGGV